MDSVFKVFLVISILTQAYTAPRNPRLSLAEYAPNNLYNFDEKTKVYSFGYDVSDPATGNIQYRSEERYPNGTVTGSYGYVDPFGKPIKFKYIADRFGYRVYSDVTTRRPLPMIPMILAGNEPTESSITWTRPPKPYKKKVYTNFATRLGTLLTKSNFI